MDTDLVELRGLLMRAVALIDRRLQQAPPAWDADGYYGILEALDKAGDKGLHWKEWYELGKIYGRSHRGLAGFFNRVAERVGGDDYSVRITDRGREFLAARRKP